jgi:drug/metabolite transporter (DMT)-like permease
MSWAVWLTTSILSVSIAVILQRFIQKDSGLNPLGFIVLPCAIATILLLIIALSKGFDTRWELVPKWNLALSALLWPVANIAYVYALRRAEASQYSILFTARVLWTILVSVVFLNESLRKWALVGALFLFASSLLAVWEEGLSLRRKSTIFCLTNAFFVGLAIANDGIILAHGYDVISYTVFAFAFTPILIGGLSSASRSSMMAIIKNHRTLIGVTILAILYAISEVTLFWAFQKGKELSILASLNQTQTILIVLGAAIFLKERRYLTRRLIAAAISLVGVLLVINA